MVEIPIRHQNVTLLKNIISALDLLYYFLIASKAVVNLCRNEHQGIPDYSRTRVKCTSAHVL